MNAELAALYTVQQLMAEHGEVFMTNVFSAVLSKRCIHQTRAVGALGRAQLTRRQAVEIVMIIQANMPEETGR